ncbi:CHAT domain protein [Escherichia coli]
MELLQEHGAILKVVIMPTTGEQTIIQGFDTGLLNPEISNILFLLAKTPKEISEIFVNENDNFQPTLSGLNPIFLISKENLEKIPNIYQTPFCLIFCAKEDFSYVCALKKHFAIPPIICCNSKRADLPLNKINSIYSFDKVLFSRLKFIEDKIRKNHSEKKISTKLKRRGALFNKSPWRSTLNNSTLPNELLIESLGYMLSPPKRIKDGSSKREFIEIILHSVDAYTECLKELDIPLPTEVLLFAPGMHSFLYDKNNDFYELITENLSTIEKKFLIDGVLRNPGYSGIRLDINSDRKELFKSPAFRYLTSLRRAEMRLTTAAITLFSINKKIPAIRLPNAINHYSNYLKNLEDLETSSGINSEAFITKSKAFNTVIRRALGCKLRTYISKNYSDLSFVCDVPLDWIRFNNIPIMFSHEISRINATPGNVLLQSASAFPRVLVKASELRKVLVIRSFEPDDHLKFILENAIEIFKKQMPDLDCEIIDVRSKAEFIDALNQYQGHVLVMDCHGNHDGNGSHGWLIIGEDKVDTWSLRKIARIPPIVILSACLTSALSGSHASVANGFVISGALSVIGTLLPVNAIDSAVFVSRLIYRFYEFPSTLSTNFTHVNVRLFLSVFLRMSYASDLIRGFLSEDLIPNNSWRKDAVDINMYINMLHHDWYDYVINKLTMLTGLTKKDVLDFIDRKLFITETMCYSQIGFPDAITISLKD